MAQLEVVPVGKQKRRKEIQMPQNETPPETNEQTADTVEENAQAATSDRETAALEEALARQQIAQRRSESDAVAAEMDKPPEVTLIGAAAKGREYLLQQMREHAATTAANKKTYVPPPMTDRQMERTQMELEAGRRAQAKHQAQYDNRPMPKPDPREAGPSTPVHRPNDVVPDPMDRAVQGSGGKLKPFSPSA